MRVPLGDSWAQVASTPDPQLAGRKAHHCTWSCPSLWWRTASQQGSPRRCWAGPERQLRPWGIRGFLDHLSWRSVQDKRTHRSPDLRLARSTWLLSLKGLKGLPFAPSPAPAGSPAAVPWPTQRGLCVPCQSSGPGCSRSVSPDQTLRPQPRRRFWGNQVVVKD